MDHRNERDDHVVFHDAALAERVVPRLEVEFLESRIAKPKLLEPVPDVPSAASSPGVPAPTRTDALAYLVEVLFQPRADERLAHQPLVDGLPVLV